MSRRVALAPPAARTPADRLCLNQTQIDDEIACLPLFLAGCKQLLVLAGDTYLSRLWACVELYVFLEMGGDAEQIEVRPFGRLSAAEQPRLRAAAADSGGYSADPARLHPHGIDRSPRSSASPAHLAHGGTDVTARDASPSSSAVRQPPMSSSCAGSTPPQLTPQPTRTARSPRVTEEGEPPREPPPSPTTRNIAWVEAEGARRLGPWVDEPMLALEVALAGFDVAEAQCDDGAMRERLLFVIEAGFGSTERFNERLKAVMRAALQRARKEAEARRARRSSRRSSAEMRNPRRSSRMSGSSLTPPRTPSVSGTRRVVPGAQRLSRDSNDVTGLAGSRLPHVSSQPTMAQLGEPESGASAAAKGVGDAIPEADRRLTGGTSIDLLIPGADGAGGETGAPAPAASSDAPSCSESSGLRPR